MSTTSFPTNDIYHQTPRVASCPPRNTKEAAEMELVGPQSMWSQNKKKEKVYNNNINYYDYNVHDNNGQSHDYDQDQDQLAPSQSPSPTSILSPSLSSSFSSTTSSYNAFKIPSYLASRPSLSQSPLSSSPYRNSPLPSTTSHTIRQPKRPRVMMTTTTIPVPAPVSGPSEPMLPELEESDSTKTDWVREWQAGYGGERCPPLLVGRCPTPEWIYELEKPLEGMFEELPVW